MAKTVPLRGIATQGPAVDTLVIYTSSPAHLWLWWSYWPPIKTPRYVIIRGTRVHRGFTFSFPGWTPIEQSQPGATTVHSFDLMSIACGKTIWYVLADALSLEPPTYISVPAQRSTRTCPAITRWCRVHRNTWGYLSPGQTLSIGWQVEDEDTDNLWPWGGNQLRFGVPTSPNWTTSHTWWFQPFFFACSGWVRLVDSAGNIIVQHSIPSMPPGVDADWTFSDSYPKGLADYVYLVLHNDGPGGLYVLGNGHKCSVYHHDDA